MSESIYNISSEYLWLLQEIEAADGELSDELLEKLQQNEDNRDVKFDNLAYISRKIADENNAIDIELERLEERKERNLSNIARLDNLILKLLQLYELKNKAGNLYHKTVMNTFTTRTSKSVLVDDKLLEKYNPITNDKYLTSPFISYVIKEKLSDPKVVLDIKNKSTVDNQFTCSLNVDKNAVKEVLIAQEDLDKVKETNVTEPSLFDVTPTVDVPKIDFAVINTNTTIKIK